MLVFITILPTFLHDFDDFIRFSFGYPLYPQRKHLSSFSPQCKCGEVIHIKCVFYTIFTGKTWVFHSLWCFGMKNYPHFVKISSGQPTLVHIYPQKDKNHPKIMHV